MLGPATLPDTRSAVEYGRSRPRTTVLEQIHMKDVNARPAWGALLLALAAVAGTALSIYNYLGNEGINHTQGAASMIGSTAIMVVAAFAIARVRGIPVWLRTIILILILLDILATGIAGWFLETWLLMAFMAVALLGWFLHVLFGPARQCPPSPEIVGVRTVT